MSLDIERPAGAKVREDVGMSVSGELGQCLAAIHPYFGARCVVWHVWRSMLSTSDEGVLHYLTPPELQPKSSR